jgi:anthranilate/para-aminobenzoate synthase component I
MTLATPIHTDLATPLGAYLRLRAEGAASFLLESVERGRLGRYSLVGSGSRLVGFEEAEAEVSAGRPVVGYLGYDHVARIEPTVPLPDAGPDLPESRFVVADRIVRFDHLTAETSPLALYRALRRVNPSPYLFLLELGPDLSLVGSSPEMLR